MGFSRTTVVNSLPLRKGAQVQNAIVPLNYFQIVFLRNLLPLFIGE